MRRVPISARPPEGALLSARPPEGALLSARPPEGALRPRGPFGRAAALGLLLGSLAQPSVSAADPGSVDAGPARSSEEQARRAQTVAKGKGVEVTLGQLEDYIEKQPPTLRTRYLDVAQRKELLDSLLRLELLAAEAKARGLDDNPAVRQTVRDNAVQALVRSAIDEKVTAESIPREQIAAHYEQNADEFHRPAERRASQIVLATRDEAEALLAAAKAADLRGFGELARKHSVDAETKLRGGDLTFFAAEPKDGDDRGRKVDPAVRKAVFALAAVGDTAHKPVPVAGQFAIVRLTGERPERHVALSDAEGPIRSKLWRERRQQAVDALLANLRERHKPQVFTERVDLVKFDDMDKRPPGFSPDPPPLGGGPSRETAPKPSRPAADATK